MSRINANVPSLIARTNLACSNEQLQTALTRLSTGLRINSGRDDAAGLIASNSLDSDLVGAKTAISNSQQASGIVATADGALNQVSKLLNDIRGLVTEAANSGALNSDQIQANQLQVDASLQAIDRIASTTSFQGKKLLDGSLGFITTSVNSSNIANLNIHQATISATSTSVTTPASQATLDGGSVASYVEPTAGGMYFFDLTSDLGTQTFGVGTGATIQDVANLLNTWTGTTGVTVDTSGGSFLFNSVSTGASAFITFQKNVGLTVGNPADILALGPTGAANGADAVTTNSGALNVNLTVTTGAAKASITGLSTSGVLTSQHVIEVAGSRGIEVFTFGTGTTAAQIASAINLVTDATGVTASTTGASVLFQSRDYGSSNAVEIKQISGAGFTGAGSRTTGTDVAGHINGAAFTGRGLNVALKTGTLSLDTDLMASFGTATGSTAFNITGGGATFQIGSEVLTNQQVRIGINGTNTGELGGLVNGTMRRLFEIRSGQSSDLDSNPTDAYQIIEAAINRVSILRGRLGALQSTTFDSNVASLNDRVSNLTQSLSYLRDADFAVETANLTRAQILVQSGTSVLSIANSGPQQILALLPRG